MKKTLISLVILISIFGMVSGCVFPPPTPNDSRIYVVPSISTVNLGDPVTITIICEPTQEIRAWEYEILYNESILNIHTFSFGEMWISYAPDVFYSPAVTYQSGKILGCFSLLLGEGVTSVSSGSTMTFTFDTISTGISYIKISNAHLYNLTSELPININNGNIYVV